MAKKTKKTVVVDKRETIDINKKLKKVDVGVKDGVFIFTSPLTIEQFAPKINKSSGEIIKNYFMKGQMKTINTLLDEEEIAELCLEHGFDFKIEKEINLENILENIDFDDDKKSLKTRTPIVTIMGHVDHGKTTLLDTIRHSSVTNSEAGGITQHIGAYQIVNKDNKEITFIDTPGHEAFSEIRARGANVTDIVILVVAADDGMSVQTHEALDHALSAGVEIIIFINKMDKPEANPEKVMSQLAERDIMPEEWGGKYVFVKGSAKNHEGIDELLESIIVLSEIKEYKANPNRLAFGTILEANLDKGFGPVATLLIQNGTLRKNDHLVAGFTFGKVRMMFDDLGNEIDEALPSKPVKIAGLEEVPKAGDRFLVLDDEKQIKTIALQIKEKQNNINRNNTMSEEKRQLINEGGLKNLNIILRADVHGSLEAIKQMLLKIDIEGTNVNLIRSAIGGITETDIRLAQASHALIIGFNVRANRVIKDLATQVGVEIQNHNIIYKLKEDIQGILKGTLDPIIVEEVLGEAEVQKTWKHSDIGTIAGCKVLSGKIVRNGKIRLIRDQVVVYESETKSLQHGTKTVNEVLAGNECGITIKNFNDIKEKDIIESYTLISKSYDEVNEDGKSNKNS